MHTNTAQYGVVAKRRLPSDFHTPVPLIPPAARINGTRRIRRATSVAVLPSVKLYKTAGKVSAALSPDKNPLAVGSLPVVWPKSNSRFFTDCYHQAAAIRPGDRCKTSVLGSVLSRLADANGSATPAPEDVRKSRDWALSSAPYAITAALFRHRSGGPGGWRRNRRGYAARSSVRLPAQEGRDVELVFLEGVVHRRLPPKRVETLMSRTLGIFRHRLATARHGGRPGRAGAPAVRGVAPPGA